LFTSSLPITNNNNNPIITTWLIKKDVKAPKKKNEEYNALSISRAAVASTKTVPPSNAEKAASTATAATTTTLDNKAVKATSTIPPIPLPASDEHPVIGVKTPKVEYLPSSAKALEAAASNQQSGTGSGSMESEVMFLLVYLISFLTYFGFR
jgi:hypothetical protein